MKLAGKIIGAAVLILAALYYGSFLIMPSITVSNDSDATIQSVHVTLPDSTLNFGSINRQQQNTIHYALHQSNGDYQYRVVDSNGAIRTGRCGSVMNNEIHKRVQIQVNKHDVICSD